MNDHERWVVETLLATFSARIGQDLRQVDSDQPPSGDEDTLSPTCEAWVRGYLTAHLCFVRGLTTGNPNVTAEEMAEIASIVRHHTDEIAATLYG
jgi:hypothetical protein